MKRAEVFPSTYISQPDVAAPFIATVGGVTMETLKNDEGNEEKAVLHFTENHVKPMILNNTNWSVLESAYGEDSDSWIGNPVEVYVDHGVMFGKKKVGGVRLRIPSGQAKPAPAIQPQPEAHHGSAFAHNTTKALRTSVKIVEVKSATGTTNGQPWTRFGVVASDNRTYGTYAKGAAEFARVRVADQQVCHLDYAVDGNKLTLLEITLAGPAFQVAAQEPGADIGIDADLDTPPF